MHLKNYVIYRRDRNLENSNKLSGGGVLIAVKKNICSNFIPIETYIDQVFVSVRVHKINYIFGCVYIPPGSHLSIYQHHCDTIENLCLKLEKDNFLVCGDFNQPNVAWELEDFGINMGKHCNQQSLSLINTYGLNGLKQVNDIRNSKGVLLDLFFTHIESLEVSTASDILTNISDHHTPYCLRIPFDSPAEALCSDMKIFDYCNADYVGLNNFYSNVNWNEILCSGNIDDVIDKFYEVLYIGMNKFIPTKKLYAGPNRFPRWFSMDLIRLVREKREAHDKYRRSASIDDYNLFKSIRSSCKRLNEELYDRYIRKVEESISTNPNYFWRFMSDIRNNNTIPSTMTLNGLSACNGQEIVDFMADHFGSNYSSLTNVSFSDNVLVSNELSNFTLNISLENVFELINNLEDTQTSGPDNIPSCVIKSCIYSLCTPIYKLFSMSLSSCMFPKFWKNTYIRPIHKSGDRHKIENYRGVCIQSILPKLLDKFVSSEIMRNCVERISKQQHGFMKGRSTLSNLLEYRVSLSSALENRNQVDAIYTDFPKAFDRIDHELLLVKLKRWGFSQPVLAWLHSFITHRQQSVKVHNFVSHPIPVTSGVPQGSHCGPILFTIFVNDLLDCIKYSRYLMFADDLKIFKIISNITDCIELQEDLDNIYQWSITNALHLNIEKCSTISFVRHKHPTNFIYSLGSINLAQVAFIKDLGVTFDNRLTFSKHIFEITNKARKQWGFVSRNSYNFNVSTLKILYCSLVRPFLEYCAPVWSPHLISDIHAIELIQKKFLRKAEYRIGLTHVTGSYERILNMLNLLSLENRRIYTDLCFLYKLINNSIKSEFLFQNLEYYNRISVVETRVTPIFRIPFKRTNYDQSSSIIRCMNEANKFIHPSWLHVPLDSFKRRVISRLITA